MGNSIPSQTAGTSKLLLEEHPLQVLPTLAVALGLNEAIIVQQLHYWLRGKYTILDKRRWHYETLEQWKQQFPFWSASTIRRTLANLEGKGVILARKFSPNSVDNTKWYAIDYDKLNSLSPDTRILDSCTSVQNEQVDKYKALEEKSASNKGASTSAQNEQVGDRTSVHSEQVNENNDFQGNRGKEQGASTSVQNEQTSVQNEQNNSQRLSTETTTPDLTHTPLTPQAGNGVCVEMGQDECAAAFNQSLNEQAREVLAHLQKVTQRPHDNLAFIKAILNDGATVADCILVIDWWKAVKIIEQPNQAMNFNASTPFKRDYFSEYRAFARQWHEGGREPPKALRRRSAADEKRDRLQDVKRQMREVAHARTRGHRSLHGRDGEVIDGVEFHRVDD